MIYTCPFCRSMFEMGGDHQAEPCADCYRAGYRIDSCGNRSRINAIDDQRQHKSRADYVRDDTITMRRPDSRNAKV